MRKLFVLVLCIGMVTLFMFHDYWLADKFLTANDYHNFSFQTRLFLQTALQHGRIDCWCPYQYGGQPLYALPIWSPFYPVNLALNFLPVPDQLVWGAMIHLLFGGLFMYLWLRELRLGFSPALTGALCFCFSPFVMQHVNEIDNVMRTIVWIPLIFYAGMIIISGLEIVGCLLLSMGLGMMLLAGHIQFAYYTMIIFVIYYTYQAVTVLISDRSKLRALKIMFSFGIVITLAVGISAIQFFPAWYAAGLTTRADSPSWRFTAAHSLTPDQLLNIFIPQFWQGWGMTEGTSFAYLGATAPLLLLLVVRFHRTRLTMFFAAMVVLALIVSLGKFTPVFHLLFMYVPGFNLFRGPARFLLIYVFFACTLISYAVALLQQRSGNHTARRWLQWLIAAQFFLGLFLYLFIWFYPTMFLTGMRRLVVFSYNVLKVGQTRSLAFYLNRLDVSNLPNATNAITFFLVTTLAFWLLLIARQRLSARVWNGWLVFLLVTPLISYSSNFITLGPLNQYSPQRVLLETVKTAERDRNEPFRIAQAEYLSFNQGMAERLACLDGYGGIIIRDYASLVATIEGIPPADYYAKTSIGIRNYTSPALNLVNTRYIITRAEHRAPVIPARLELLNRDGDFLLYRNRGAMPNIFPVTKSLHLSQKGLLTYLWGEQRYPLTTVILPEDEPAMPAFTRLAQPDEVAITRLSAIPDRREWLIETPHPTYLVVSENYYPFWQFELDGKPHDRYRAYHYLLGTWVPAGSHHLVLRFVPYDFYLGCATTLLALIILILALYWAIKRRLIHNIHDDENVLLDYLEHAPASLALVRGMEGKLFRQSALTSPILDIGCGEGLFASIVFDQDIDVGIDLDLRELRKRATPDRYHHRLNANAQGLPFKQDHFQTIISNCVLEHVSDLEIPIQEIYRVLKPGGKYVFTTHSHLYGDFLFYRDLCYRFGWYRLGDWYARTVNKVFKHHSLWSPQRWEANLRRAGFRDITVKYYLSRRAMHLFDLLLPGSLPARLNKLLWGRWAIFPRRFLAAIHTHIFKHYYNEDTLVGAGLCIEAYK